ncbi:hypothetical protein R1flu_006421 [Riccia fluitans]|uniref:Uncharacterized protein n=1 Tax=Riccia fluitans TaxID=41844 RepID=A0ABD1Z014_9MARC
MKEDAEPESIGIMVYCTFVNLILDLVLFVGKKDYSRVELNIRKLDSLKLNTTLGHDLQKKPLKEIPQIFTDYIYDNPNFKQFEQEAIKDAISTGIFGSLKSNGLKYIPHPSLGKKADKDDTDKKAFDRLRSGKEKTPLEKKKKKAKCKWTIRGPNVSSGDGSLNAGPSKDPTAEAPASPL